MCLADESRSTPPCSIVCKIKTTSVWDDFVTVLPLYFCVPHTPRTSLSLCRSLERYLKITSASFHSFLPTPHSLMGLWAKDLAKIESRCQNLHLLLTQDGGGGHSSNCFARKWDSVWEMLIISNYKCSAQTDFVFPALSSE